MPKPVKVEAIFKDRNGDIIKAYFFDIYDDAQRRVFAAQALDALEKDMTVITVPYS